MDNSKDRLARLQASIVSVSRVHFAFVLLAALQIMIYDAWKLVTPEYVLWRWVAVVLLLVVVTAVWYLAKVVSSQSLTLYTGFVFVLIVADITFASFSVYMQRGMASRAVALYAIPIIVSTILLSRAALFATALLCIAAYVLTAVSYFVLNFNEGYKIELYGEVGFYSALFLLLAALLWAVIRPKK